MLVEGVHFDLALTGWYDLGWKALAVNLSDVAAMGARAARAFVSIGLRSDETVAGVLDLYRGMRDLAGRSGCAIAGGDTVSVREARVINITVLGDVPAGEEQTLLRRDRGRVGDLIGVTGTLGGSAAGLFALQHSESCTAAQCEVLAAVHRRPEPRLIAGDVLRRAGVRCAMDVSDGLMADLGRVCAASRVTAVVRAAALPVHPVAAAAYPDRALAWAAGGGEDYELLFAVSPRAAAGAFEALRAAGVQASEIGTLVDGGGPPRLVDDTGRAVPLLQRGWDHFAAPRS
jgi:thiamine-monophosphate kinase